MQVHAEILTFGGILDADFLNPAVAEGLVQQLHLHGEGGGRVGQRDLILHLVGAAGEVGILGGLSSGQPVVARAFVKPIPSIALEQHTVTAQGQATTIRVGGRHDICAIPRIVPVLKAMTALACADLFLLDRRLGRER